MVNKERVQLWVDALQDETLIQGYQRLASRREGDPWKQCCLDVACRVAMAHGVELEEVFSSKATINHEQKRGYRDMHESNYTSLPAVVRDWYGFDDREVGFGEGFKNAIELNDDVKLTFPQIAQEIEWHFLTEDAT